MNIKDEIEKLIELQELDSHFLAFKAQRDEELPEKIAALKDGLAERKTIISTLEEEYTRIQLRKKEKELDLATKEEAVSKCNGQLYLLKTNKEYAAKLKEIESFKADASVIEEDILKIMDELDAKNKELSEKKGLIDQDEAAVNKEVSALGEQIKDLDAQVKNLEGKRGRISEGVEKALFARYQHLLDNRQGRALVPLQGFSCGGCFMTLPRDIMNKVKQYHEVIDCEFCARMLYIAEDFQHA
ncbi:zinc ribbon domain-containing protein [Candidatus Omnitrophota bacterium]